MFDLKKTGATENVAVPLRENTVNCLSTKIEKPRYRRDALAVGGSVAGLSLVEALCARMCAVTRGDGSVIEPNGTVWSDLRAAAEGARLHRRAWIEQRDIYGTLVEEPRFVEPFEKWLGVIWPEGKATVPGRHLRDGCQGTVREFPS